MPSRRESRLCAVQILFQMEFNQAPLDEVLAGFWEERRAGPTARRFVEELVRGVKANQPQIDELLQRCASNWSLPRMASVDRNVMRVAVYEMLHVPDIPPAVSINEALEIVKQLGDVNSSRFVNGILDRIRKELHRPARGAAEGAT